MAEPPARRVDLESYLSRVHYAGSRDAVLPVLEELHLAHLRHIPFENLDILLGRPIVLELGALEAKLVHGGRGGYCFEQNTLFAAVLEELGFSVTRLAARVRSGATRLLPRTHMLLKVDVDGDAVIADVGFGGDGLLGPISLDGEPMRQVAWTYRIGRDTDLYVLQSLRHGVWQDLYAFTLEPHYPIDFEMANHYVSTHPSSRFVQTLTAQRSTPEARYILRNRELSFDYGDGGRRPSVWPSAGSGDTRTTPVQVIRSDEELLDVLRNTFGLEFPIETQFFARLEGTGAVSHF
jgi:N-hydroxyarylamine O-acetyltransferase